MNDLIDTNILTRLVQPTHAMHREALDAVTLLIGRAHNLHVAAQNLYEFWVVATRPAIVNGLGKTATEALADLVYLEGLFHRLDETVPIYSVWRGLVASTPILGKNGHDARLVAAMTVHGLTHLLTFNTQDFRQYPAITAVAPADVLGIGPHGPRGCGAVARIGATTGRSEPKARAQLVSPVPVRPTRPAAARRPPPARPTAGSRAGPVGRAGIGWARGACGLGGITRGMTSPGRSRREPSAARLGRDRIGPGGAGLG